MSMTYESVRDLDLTLETNFNSCSWVDGIGWLQKDHEVVIIRTFLECCQFWDSYQSKDTGITRGPKKWQVVGCLQPSGREWLQFLLGG